MLIALDYDLTYTADPDGWDAVVTLMRARGHDFVCITGRHTPPGPAVLLLDGTRTSVAERVPPMPIVCAGDRLKSLAALRAGYRVDVWIDDCPGTIEACRVVDWENA